MSNSINGDTALAWGAIEAGVSVVTGYPGSPGTDIFNTLADCGSTYGHHAEWCLNEAVALNVAAGASQGGKRALVCLKSVGMNVALDTLMVLNMTGIHGGLVILLGDDPGAWGSQNEQDTRWVGNYTELPVLEPATPQEGRDMVRWAFDHSEANGIIVIIRLTRSFSQRLEEGPDPAPPTEMPAREPDREPLSWVSALRTTEGNHRRLHQTLATVEAEANSLPYNTVEGDGRKGIIAAGFAYTKLQDALEGADRSPFRILKLGSLYPLPARVVSEFLGGCDEVVVFEEVDPYVEDMVKAVGYDAGATPKVLGKRTGHVRWEGELFRWNIQDTLKKWVPGFSPSVVYAEAEWEKEKPVRISHCAGCPYVEIITAFREEAKALGQNPFLAGDPGCVVMAADLLDTKLCMGSAIGIAHGLKRSGVRERTVAVIGDSAFYHSGITPLVHARATGSDMLVMILDNSGAVTTGGQPTPDRGMPGCEGTGPAVGMRELAECIGLPNVWEVLEEDSEDRMREVFRSALASQGMGMLIVRKECKPAD